MKDENDGLTKCVTTGVKNTALPFSGLISSRDHRAESTVYKLCGASTRQQSLPVRGTCTTGSLKMV